MTAATVAAEKTNAVARKGKQLASATTAAAAKSIGAVQERVTSVQNASDVAAVTLEAYMERTKKLIHWRSVREQRHRTCLAWMFNALIYFCAGVIVLAYGVKALGSAAMTATVVGWLLALAQVFFIIEPLQVVVVVAFPFCVNEDTHCGRCFRRAQWVYNELLAP